MFSTTISRTTFILIHVIGVLSRTQTLASASLCSKSGKFEKNSAAQDMEFRNAEKEELEGIASKTRYVQVPRYDCLKKVGIRPGEGDSLEARSSRQKQHH